MKVLLVNKFHYLKGGSEKYYFELGKLLEENGHEVAYFSMNNEKNIKLNNKEYFVEEIDLNSNNKLKALDVIYSKENKKIMEKALDDFKPDIVHINNFQRQLSSSIISAIRKRNIPIIYTAHDLQAICPNIVMLNRNNEICNKCKNGKYYNCIKGKCIKNSTLKSLLGGIEGYYYRLRNIYNKIDHIITPSIFYEKELKKDGIKNVTGLHNFILLEDYQVETKDEGYLLYIGRLSKEKGIFDLVKAMKDNKETLLIAGSGPEKEKIEKLIKEEKLTKRVKLLGQLKPSEVKDYVRKAHAVVVPSLWYENCPYSVLETIAIGKPIIGANIGGIPELVIDGENGLLFESGNSKDLSKKINELYSNKKLYKKFCNNSKKLSKQYDKSKYYEDLMKIYNEVIEG